MAESLIQKKSFKFALKIIELYKKLQTLNEYVISRQLLRSGTSIGANVEEASAGQSRKDFLAKMAIASTEARETQDWLRLLEESHLVNLDISSELQDLNKLIRILTSIVKTTKENS